ncbi:hypothetical protein HDU79_007256 [Rhizoclosmatium sp. JEL0117]|nr:hypothetical protein HDU79_007256 [Rhizoclosmatium sp. JEL0117]
MSYECSLHGAVPAASVAPLIERICGLSGLAAPLVASAKLPQIAEVEMVFNERGGRGGNAPLRIRSDWCAAEPSVKTLQDLKWSLLFIGQPQPPKPGQLATIRAVYEAPVMQGDVFDYLDLLDYELTLEFMRKGYRFHYGAISITISCIHKFQSKHDLSSITPLDPSGTWLVELCTERTATENIPFASEKLAQFARNLRGLVDLSIVDINKNGTR